MKRYATPATYFRPLLFRGNPLPGAQGHPSDPASGKGTVQSETAKSPAPKAKKNIQVRLFSQGSNQGWWKKNRGGDSRISGLGIGRGFQNMGRAIKKAWTGDSGN